MTDMFLVSCDYSNTEIPTLIVARREEVGGVESIKVINTIQGDESVEIYNCLTGGVYLKNTKEAPIKVFRDGDDESDYSYCPRCHEPLGSNDFVYNDFYERNWKPMHCVECGQSMVWK